MHLIKTWPTRPLFCNLLHIQIPAEGLFVSHVAEEAEWKLGSDKRLIYCKDNEYPSGLYMSYNEQTKRLQTFSPLQKMQTCHLHKLLWSNLPIWGCEIFAECSTKDACASMIQVTDAGSRIASATAKVPATICNILAINLMIRRSSSKP